MILTIVLGVISLLLVLILVYSWMTGRKQRLEISEEEAFKRFVVHATKQILIDGVPFSIRKINVMDHLEGAKVLSETFAIYRNKTEKATIEQIDTKNIEKLKSYLADIICQGCIRPKFSRKPPQEGALEIHIEELFTDWTLAQRLAQEIFEFSQGKKK